MHSCRAVGSVRLIGYREEARPIKITIKIKRQSKRQSKIKREHESETVVA
jgi:hypothetical protein